MAKKVFAVYLAKEDVPNSEAYATLELPASPWELWDAMEKVRLKDGEALYMEIDDYYAFEYLAPPWRTVPQRRSPVPHPTSQALRQGR